MTYSFPEEGQVLRSAHAASRPAPPASTADADRARIQARMDKPEPPRPDLRSPPPRSDVRPPPHRSDLRPPPTPTPQTPAPPSKPPRSRTGVIIALAIVGFIAVVSIIDTFSGSDDGSSSGDEGTADTSDCLRPAGAWLDTLQSAFYEEYRSAPSRPPRTSRQKRQRERPTTWRLTWMERPGRPSSGRATRPCSRIPDSSRVRTQPRPSSRISGSTSPRTLRRGHCFWTTTGHLRPSLVSEMSRSPRPPVAAPAPAPNAPNDRV